MTSHRKSLRLLQLNLVVFVMFPAAWAAQACGSKSSAFELYPADSNIGRTDLIHDETATARPVVVRRGTRVFQVLINKRTGRELFRVEVGTTEATWWVYGLVREADFNGDGIPDFSWHGGDDVSDKNLVVLSSPRGYRKVDIDATLRGEWRRRFPADPPENLLPEDPSFSQIKLGCRDGRLTLGGVVHYSDIEGPKQQERPLQLRQRDFLYVK